MEQGPSWEANRSLATQIPSILWNSKFHYRIHNSPLPVPTNLQNNNKHQCSDLSLRRRLLGTLKSTSSCIEMWQLHSRLCCSESCGSSAFLRIDGVCCTLMLAHLCVLQFFLLRLPSEFYAVHNNQFTLCNTPEERIFHLHRRGSLKSCIDVEVQTFLYCCVRLVCKVQL